MDDAQLEHAFRRDLAKRTTRSAVPSFVVAVVAVIAWTVVDRMAAPEQASSFFVLRLTTAALILLIVAVLARVKDRLWAGAVAAVCVVTAVQVSSAWMLAMVPPPNAAYLLSMCLTLCGAALVLDWSWLFSLLISAITVLAVALAMVFSDHPVSGEAVGVTGIYLGTACTVAIIGQYLRCRTSLQEFRARALAQAARHEVEEQQARNAALVETLQVLVRQDHLTGLANRRALTEALTAAVQRARRSGQHLGLIMLDVDHFKALNDSHGHAVGDHVLKVVADCLRRRLRVTDVAARYGGEEFVILLPGGGPEDTLLVADELRRQIAAATAGVQSRRGQGQPSQADRSRTPAAVTVSAGAAVFPLHAATEHDLLAAADAALYTAKGAGRNRCVLAPVPSS